MPIKWRDMTEEQRATIRKRSREYRKTHPAAAAIVNARRRARYKLHPRTVEEKEVHRIQLNRWRSENRDAVNARRRKYMRDHPLTEEQRQHKLARDAAYRQANRERLRISSSKTYFKYHERRKAENKQRYYARHEYYKALHKAYNEERRRNLAHSYVAEQIMRGTDLPRNAIPKALLELKRAELQLKRYLSLHAPTKKAVYKRRLRRQRKHDKNNVVVPTAR